MYMSKFIEKIMAAGLIGLAAMPAEAAKYTFNVTNAPKDAKIELTLNATNKKSTITLTDGKGSVELNGFKPQYATMKMGYYSNQLYLEPDKDLTVTFDAKNMRNEITVTGVNVAINKYLTTTKFSAIGYADSERDDAGFMAKADSVYNANIAALTKAKLPADFVKQEKVRLKYLSYDMFPMYQTYHAYFKKLDNFTPNAAYYKKLAELTDINGALLIYPEYKSFISNAILSQAFKSADRATYNKAFIDYASANIKDAAVLEYVADNYIYGTVSGAGIDGKDEIIAYYHKVVKNPEMTKRMDDICAKWSALKTGSPSPSFTCPDINGKMVSLADLKGKYVYIDVWATWCGPCRGELPHLEKLEVAYAGKDIAFVSLSCDQDKKAWEKMVTSKNMKGIQLHMGNTDSFMQKYIINGIPRFILLDRNGNIIKAEAPRPSNPETAKLFDELLKK